MQKHFINDFFFWRKYSIEKITNILLKKRKLINLLTRGSTTDVRKTSDSSIFSWRHISSSKQDFHEASKKLVSHQHPIISTSFDWGHTHSIASCGVKSFTVWVNFGCFRNHTYRNKLPTKSLGTIVSMLPVSSVKLCRRTRVKIVSKKLKPLLIPTAQVHSVSFHQQKVWNFHLQQHYSQTADLEWNHQNSENSRPTVLHGTNRF